MYTVKQYNKGLVANTILTIKTALSPRTPRADRKTPVKLYSYNRENARRVRFNNLITK